MNAGKGEFVQRRRSVGIIEPTGRHSSTVYKLRHCLMIGGAIFILLDIGLFLGGISIIASGYDMDTYGFAALIGVSVVAMVISCLAFFCGCRARRYDQSSTTAGALVTHHKQSDTYNRRRLQPQPQSQPQPSSVSAQRYTPTYQATDKAASRWSVDATCGESVREDPLVDQRPPVRTVGGNAHQREIKSQRNISFEEPRRHRVVTDIY